MGWKIPTMGDFVGAALGSVPRVIKYFKDKGRVNEVTKINDAVDSADDKSVNSVLREITTKEDNRRKANS